MAWGADGGKSAGTAKVTAVERPRPIGSVEAEGRALALQTAGGIRLTSAFVGGEASRRDRPTDTMEAWESGVRSMSTRFIGFGLCNLFVPEEPTEFALDTAVGTWTFRRFGGYEEWKDEILQRGACGRTYRATTTVDTSGGRTAALEASFDELLPICLGASYLTGMSVGPDPGVLGSEVSFLQVGPHFPRPRGMGPGRPAAGSLAEFKADLGTFVARYRRVEKEEKARVLIQHWLDAQSFWSLEDIVLSTTTLLEVIAATAERASPVRLGSVAERLVCAAKRFSLRELDPDFRKMRNDLVQEGTLSGSKFPNSNSVACAELAASALNWIDLYLHATFGLGSPRRERFERHAFAGVSAFSFD